MLDTILKQHFNVSVITKIEFLGWRKFDDKKLKKAKEFLDFASVINLTKPIVRESKGQRVKAKPSASFGSDTLIL